MILQVLAQQEQPEIKAAKKKRQEEAKKKREEEGK